MPTFYATAAPVPAGWEVTVPNVGSAIVPDVGAVEHEAIDLILAHRSYIDPVDLRVIIDWSAVEHDGQGISYVSEVTLPGGAIDLRIFPSLAALSRHIVGIRDSLPEGASLKLYKSQE